MSEVRGVNWTDGRPGTGLTPEERAIEQHLELLDRVIGLEQQVGELQSANLLSPSETVAAERNLAAMRSSMTWRAGRLVTLPVRAAKVVKRRLLG
ncbi:hypothetical protein [Agromyces binzhouensis]|uniref:Uncharacterized protein n=1 Tax=Agromyces binzhouensis TaxID=1817495 RepID=A0A4V1QS47_9MICO|nr:hypothetical protein [Agromyces binzhouensis]RXZ47133.1 hypothetical protein ESO86_09220 [Agromyces binzhouensis]